MLLKFFTLAAVGLAIAFAQTIENEPCYNDDLLATMQDVVNDESDPNVAASTLRDRLGSEDQWNVICSNNDFAFRNSYSDNKLCKVNGASVYCLAYAPGGGGTGGGDANERFAECCRRETAEPCWEYCDYGEITQATLVEMYTKKTCGVADAQRMVKCATQNQDTTACCSGAGMSALCQQLCVSPTPNVTPRYSSCQVYTEQYGRCFEDGVNAAIANGNL